MRFVIGTESVICFAAGSLCNSQQDKEQMTTGIYTTKWFLQCFIDRVSVWIILWFMWTLTPPLASLRPDDGNISVAL